MGTKGLSTANNGAEVVGVGEPINGHQQRGFTQTRTAVDQGVQIVGLGSGGLQDNPLVDSATTELGQPSPGDLFHQHP